MSYYAPLEVCEARTLTTVSLPAEDGRRRRPPARPALSS
jgi:hypothetical protein